MCLNNTHMHMDFISEMFISKCHIYVIPEALFVVGKICYAHQKI
jgi:hypothetical protein